MATAEDYASWIVANQEKKGTPEFENVANAYRIARSGTPSIQANAAQDKTQQSQFPSMATVLNAASNVGGPVPIGGLEAGAQMASGIGASIPAGLAGIGASVGQAFGANVDPGSVVRNVQNALTYQPRSQQGQQISQAVGYLPSKLDEFSKWLGQKTTDAGISLGLPPEEAAQNGAKIYTLATIAPAALQSVLRVPAKSAVASSEADALAAKSRNSVQDQTFKMGNDAGLITAPSQYNPSILSNIGETLGIAKKTNQLVQTRNSEAINKIARQEASLPEDSPIDYGTLAEARKELSKPYQEVADLSPAAASALDNLKRSRHRASLYWKEYNASASVDALDNAKKLDSQSAQWEAVIDNEAKKSGNADLLSRLQDARQSIAKNYNVQEALNRGNGNIDAAAIGRMYQNGDPLSGGLETIGRWQNAFQNSVKPVTSITNPGIGNEHIYAGISPGGIHAGMFQSGIPLISSLARKMAISRQVPRAYGAGALPTFAELATSPELGLLLGAETQNKGLLQ